MKKLALKLFFNAKCVGQLATVLASLAAAWLMSMIPGLPGFVVTVIGLTMDLPEGEVITKGGVIAFLTPLTAVVIQSIIQEFVARDNNKVLTDLADLQVYDGPIDSTVGPIARQAISTLADNQIG